MKLSNIKHKLAITLFVTATCSAPLSHADYGQPGGHRGEPPPEALEACAGLAEGDACSFTGRHEDEINGSCRVPPRQESLACVPEGGPKGRPGRPPE